MRRYFISIILVFCSHLALSQTTSDEFYEDASRLFHQQEFKASLIQLKNALQIDPEHVPSLVLSAEVYISLDNSPAAEETLIKARVLGADRRFINLTLAEVYRRQGKYRSILDEISTRNLPNNIVADILGFKAIAWLSLGKSTKAQELIDRADITDPDSFRTAIARILLSIGQRDYEMAIGLGEALTVRHPINSEAWNVYASGLHANGQLRSALESYTKALEIMAFHVDARISRAALELDLGLLTEAEQDLEFLKKNFPYEPRAAYLRGLVYSKLEIEDETYTGKAFTELKLCTEIIARLPPDRVSADKQLPMVAAQAHYGLSEFESSKGYLSLYLKKNDGDIGANRLMGDILLKLNDPKGAIQYLKPIHRQRPNDQQLTSLLATAYSKSGHYDKAIELLESLQKDSSMEMGFEDQLAFSLIQAGHTNTGIESLKNIFENSVQSDTSGFPLIIALLKNRRYAEALDYALRSSAQHPTNLAYRNLLGIAQQSTGATEKARKSFEFVVEKNPSSIGAHLNLAKLEESVGNRNRALEILRHAMESNPESSRVMLAKAQFYSRGNMIDEALKLAEKARLIDIDNIDVRVFLMELYLRLGQDENAITLALDTNIMEHSFESNLTLARVYQQANRPRKALSIYKQQAKKAGFHTERLYILAQSMIDLQALEDARHTLFKAIEGNPSHTASLVSYISLQLRLNENENALQRSRKFVQSHKDIPVSHLMLADSLVQLDQLNEAVKVYQHGLGVGFLPQLVLGLSSTQMELQEPESAAKTLATYWRRHEAIGGAYSVFLIEQDSWKQAKSTLKVLVESTDENPIHLNNMAYVLDQLNEPNALDYAKRAHQVAPDNPYINDTVGWLLVKSGNAEEALRYLRQAAARAGSLPEIRYHLGKALLELGRHDEARQELQSAIESGSRFNGYSDAKKILDTLS